MRVRVRVSLHGVRAAAAWRYGWEARGVQAGTGVPMATTASCLSGESASECWAALGWRKAEAPMRKAPPRESTVM